MKYTVEQIPGFLSGGDIVALREIISLLPTNGILLEAGTCFGKSAAVFAEESINQKKNIKIYSCDPTYYSGYSKLNGDLDLIEEVKWSIVKHRTSIINKFLNGYDVTFIADRVNKDFIWDIQLDCFFEDSDHTPETLSETLPWGYDHLKSGGILCGHDYEENDHTAVTTLVNKFASDRFLKVQTFNNSSVWLLKKQ